MNSFAPTREASPGALTLGDAIGRGSITTVHRAVAMSRWGIAREVAVRIFDRIGEERREFAITKLVDVARASASVRHPNVIATYDFDCDAEGNPYFVEELVSGNTVRELLAHYAGNGRRVPLDQALILAIRAAEGVAAALVSKHADGTPTDLVHGRLSARDVIVSRAGEVKVGGFGLAGIDLTGSSVQHVDTFVTRMVGAAPEVMSRKRADARGDVFSLGVLLHEMLIGPRFPVGTTSSEAAAYVASAYTHEGAFAPELPFALRDALRTALNADPYERFASAEEFAYDLRRVAHLLGISDPRAVMQRALESAFPRPIDSGIGEDTVNGLPPSFRDFIDA